MSDILRTILARKVEEVAERSRVLPLRELSARGAAAAPPPRGFAPARRARRAAAHGGGHAGG
jgi:indole-3-glycerol phosphate synthase